MFPRNSWIVRLLAGALADSMKVSLVTVGSYGEHYPPFTLHGTAAPPVQYSHRSRLHGCHLQYMHFFVVEHSTCRECTRVGNPIINPVATAYLLQLNDSVSKKNVTTKELSVQ